MSGYVGWGAFLRFCRFYFYFFWQVKKSSIKEFFGGKEDIYQKDKGFLVESLEKCRR